MRNDRIGWPNADGTAWPASVWAQLDSDIGTATFSQQNGTGQIATSATNLMHGRAISTSQLRHRDMEWRGTLQSSTLLHQHEFFFRSDGAWGATNVYFPNNCYVFEYAMASNTYNAYQVVANAGAAIAGAPGATSFTFASNTVYNVLMKLQGYFLGMKIWTVGTNEPGAWGWSTTDTAHAISATTQGVFQYSFEQEAATATNTRIGNAALTIDLAQPRRFDLFSLLADEPAGAPILGRRPVFRRF